MAISTNELINLLEKSLKYTTIVYKQSTYTVDQENFGNEYVLEFKHTDIPDDSLLFFVPAYSSNDSGNCVLTIRIPTQNTSQQTNEYIYTTKKYNIIVEQNDDLPRPAGKGDIVANRMCIFRFKMLSNQVVLCNSPLYNDATFNKLKVVDAKFYNLPQYIDPANPTISYTLVSTKEFVELQKRVKALEEKIVFGTLDPEEALKDSNAGTIYIKYEED